MRGLLALSRVIDRLNEMVGKSVGWLILLAIFVSAVNAVIRKTMNMSSNSWLELQWYLYGAAFLLASAYTLKQNEHIRIDILYGALSRRVQNWIDLLGHIFFLMPILVLMDYYLVPWVWLSLSSGEMSADAGGLIIWPSKLMLLLGFLLLTIQGISEIIKKIAVMRGIIKDPTPFVSSHDVAEMEGAAYLEDAPK